ncbi:NAD(P)-binding domain-containing protein [Candidatus Peregrinibacteria bacterium]|nr:MAG: NAD(P)-binding domain-containing protein [Candidatus Peregrinibacteria bacterium]
MTQRYLIIGHPLSFCLTTPVINGGFKELGIDAEFKTLDVLPEAFPEVMEQLKRGELAGVVATMPYKTPSMEYLDESTEEAKAVSAVNLILHQNGKLVGHNTDWLGAMGALKTAMPKLEGKQALILGAGGAARAAAYGLQKEGARVAIWNRTPERAKAFAQKMNIEWVENLEHWNALPDLIINATASSNQDRQSTLVPFPLWKNVMLALDAVYGRTSLFLEEAKAMQVPHVISGEIWFLSQVFTMFKIITGKEGPADLMTRLTHESKVITA